MMLFKILLPASVHCLVPKPLLKFLDIYYSSTILSGNETFIITFCCSVGLGCQTFAHPKEGLVLALAPGNIPPVKSGFCLAEALGHTR